MCTPQRTLHFPLPYGAIYPTLMNKDSGHSALDRCMKSKPVTRKPAEPRKCACLRKFDIISRGCETCAESLGQVRDR